MSSDLAPDDLDKFRSCRKCLEQRGQVLGRFWVPLIMWDMSNPQNTQVCLATRVIQSQVATYKMKAALIHILLYFIIHSQNGLKLFLIRLGYRPKFFCPMSIWGKNEDSKILGCGCMAFFFFFLLIYECHKEANEGKNNISQNLYLLPMTQPS